MAHSACTPLLFAKPRRRRPLISMTPMIDVVFILLIFFMLTSSFLEWRAIAMNAPAKAASGASSEGALQVLIRQHELQLGGAPVSMKALVSQAEAAVTEKSNQRFLITPEPGVPFQRTVEVLDALKAAKATNVSLVGASKVAQDGKPNESLGGDRTP